MKSLRQTKILLLEDFERLGEVGDVLEVKPGYARNYLFPSGIACLVSADALRRIERAKDRAAKLRVDRAERVAALASVLENVSITLEERASEEGHLFGSVGALQVVAALAGRDVTIDEKQVLLDHPIKELGIFNVPIRLDAETTSEIRVWVVEPTG